MAWNVLKLAEEVYNFLLHTGWGVIRCKAQGHGINSAQTITFAIPGEGCYKITIERVS